jgi:hypothetical protein
MRYLLRYQLRVATLFRDASPMFRNTEDASPLDIEGDASDLIWRNDAAGFESPHLTEFAGIGARILEILGADR